MAGVLNISEAANLALHTLMLMASESERPLRTKEAAATLRVSDNHLAKVLQRLARARLVTSTRGPGGGFLLGRQPRKITLLEIYEAIDGPLDTHSCLLGRPRCNEGCSLGEFVERTARELRAHLAGTRLSDIAGILTREEPQ